MQSNAKGIKMKIIVYILLMFAPLCTMAQSGKVVGDSAYSKGDYTAAIAAYETLLAQEGEAAEVYYNLGNAYFKNGEIAKSILNYERALLLDPNDSDIRFNLELAQSKIVDKVSEGYTIFFMQWLYAVVNSLGVGVWSVIGIVSFIVLLAALLLLFFSNSISLRKTGFTLAVLMLIVTLFANLSALHHHYNYTHRTAAIIIAPSVTAKSTPDDSGTTLFVLHEGRKVRIADDTMKNWKEIELEDGTIGWIPSSSLEVI